MRHVVVLCVLIALTAVPAAAQNPTGTLSGHVTDGKEPLPGVTVTVSSSFLQGTRTAVTTVEGDYILKFLPPGQYSVKFELQGFQTIETVAKISATQTQDVDATMPQATATEALTVTGALETISTGTSAASTYDEKLMNELPVPRTLEAAVELSPTVNTNGPGGAITISGAQSYESLFLVNGVVVNENLRGQPLDLYIEDAVQETTTTTSGISAEYGRFAGGVVNTLTKSGGNEFHGSLRANFDNDKWVAKTPLTVSREDKVNETYEGTLGGYFLADKIWFFTAFRDRDTTNASQTFYTNVPFTTTESLQRFEGKLTLSPVPSQRFVGSYMVRSSKDGNYGYTPFMDLASVYDRQEPESLGAFDYTGILSDAFFVEGQYSARHFTFQNSGSRFTDIDKGTVLLDGTLGAFYHSPVFCAVCPGADEKRDNQDIIAKGSWFVSSPTLGTHDVVLGVDRYEDKIAVNNYASGSGYWLQDDNIILKNGTIYPQFFSGSFGSFVINWPIYSFSSGDNFRTDSVFANDKWRLSNYFTFNVGVRYDKNHGEDADGNIVSDDHKVSPRLGVSYDPLANGDLQIEASYGKYVTAIANSNNIAAAEARAGTPSILVYLYNGPDINTDPNADTLLTQSQAVEQVFAWFNSLSQEEKNQLLVQSTIPGFGIKIPHSLASPSADELTLGFSKRLGSNGMVRVDYINRQFHDFYVSRIDGTTGQAVDPNGVPTDVAFIENNDNVVRKKYDAVALQASYRFTDRLNLGGAYTWSHLRGNFVGENLGSGPIPPTDLQYPEYHRQSWSNPDGDLPQDQRHRARIWAVFDLLSTQHHRLSASLLQSVDSGVPYGAASTTGIIIDPYVHNAPSYAAPPATVNYYFRPRDEFRTDTVASTDIAITYAFKLPSVTKDLELFVAPRVTNVMNRHGVVNVNSTVYTAANPGKGLVPFDPFNSKPVECPQGDTADQCAAMNANWQYGPDFGRPLATTDYQTPRTFLVSVGLRF
jgi:hypothetical protein